MGFLDKIEMAFSCPLAWEKLTGDGAKRFCGECQKHVTDLSALTRADAAALMRSADAPACVRVEIDARGRSVHRPEIRRRPAAAALSVALLAPAGADTCADRAGPALMGAPPIEAPALMGGVRVEAPPPVEVMGEPMIEELLGKIEPPVERRMGRPAVAPEPPAPEPRGASQLEPVSLDAQIAEEQAASSDAPATQCDLERRGDCR